MHVPQSEVIAMLVAVSFAAGLNVYATVATLGLLSHAGALALPPNLSLLSSWWVILFVITVLMIRWVLRGLKRLFGGAERAIERK